MSVGQHLLFISFVAAASYVQNLTGFAFGLLLLGLVGLLQLAPLPDVSNAVSMLTLVNAATLFRDGVSRVDRATLVPTISTSLVGVFVGVLLLNWLSDNVVVGLRMLLGATIAACAVLLVIRATPLARRSPAASFAATGLLSGVLGGLFSTSGPPLVYHFYRQPMSLPDIRHSLIAVFAVNSFVRLAMMTGTGRVGADAIWMAVEAAPVVAGLTWLAGRRPTRWSAQTVRRLVSVLLAAVGLGLFVPASLALLRSMPAG